MNRRLLDVLEGIETDRPPVWLMRQAGRYMPSYQALRKHHSLWDMFHTPELAAQVTLMPVEQLGVDAAILFSDILVIVEALGLSVDFPPRITPAITTSAQVDALAPRPVQEALSYVDATIRLLRPTLQVPLIGFCGGPFTVASYCLDPEDHGSFRCTRAWMQSNALSLHMLLDKLTLVTIDYLRMQVAAGAQVIQVFDSWLSELTAEERHTFAYPYLKRIIDAVSVPVILFCRHSSLFPDELIELKPSAISFDWLRPMRELRDLTPSHIAVQGNLDPSVLKRPVEEIESTTRRLLDSMRGKQRYIVNLGHGVLPDIPFEHVRHFIQEVTT